MKKKLRPIPKKIRSEYLEEFQKPLSLEKAIRRGIFINLEEEIIEYFKQIAGPSGKGYQHLIQEALRHYKDNNLKPKIVWENSR